MNKSTCLRLALYDMKQKIGKNVRFFLNVLFIQVAALVIVVFAMALWRNYSAIIKEEISMSKVRHSLNLDKNGEICSDAEKELSDYLSSSDKVTDIFRYSTIDFRAYLHMKEGLTLSISKAGLQVGNKVYQGKNDYSYDFLYDKSQIPEYSQEFVVPFEVAAVDISIPFHPTAVTTEFQHRYPGEEIYAYGKGISKDGEIVISEYMLYHFGISENLEQLIGKKLSFSIDGTQVMKDYTLVGIFNTNFFRVMANCGRPQIWIGGTKEIFSKYQCQYLAEDATTSSYITLEELEKELDDMEQFKACDYFDNGTKDEFSFIEKMKHFMKRVLFVLLVILILAVFLKLANQIYHDMLEGAAYFGMMLAMGMKKSEMWLLLFARIFVLMFLAMLVAVPVTCLMIQGVLEGVYEIFTLELSVSVGDYVQGILVVFTTFSLVFLIILYSCYRNLFADTIYANMRKN